MRRLAVFLALAAAVAGGCSSSGPGESASTKDFDKLKGAPAALAGLYRQPNAILAGGQRAFDERIAGLRGHTVVVNAWASWCGPCRFEFPFFQKQVAKRGKQVAFLGVDAEDSRDGAHRFLDKFPVPYPSFYDPDSKIAKIFHGDRSFPTTVFYDRTGAVEYLKQGGYASEEALARDISRYAR
jgi:cytochrome c biogenesis protein CcmG, thiol:disulfide interchange protein DsbE